MEIEIKKKGRPKKMENVDKTITEPKKRGRKKKEVDTEEVKVKKRRGRKAAVKFITNSLRKKIPLSTSSDKHILCLNIQENDENNTYNILNEIEEFNGGDGGLSSSISELQVDDNKLHRYHNDKLHRYHNESVLEEYLDNNNTVSIEDLYDNKLKVRIEEDKKLIDKLNELHKDDNLLNKVITELNTGINKKISEPKNKQKNSRENNENDQCIILSAFVENKEWIKKCNVSCWWCCHEFDSIPIGIPLEYKNNKFHVFGIFCSFSCLLAYTNGSKYSKHESLIHLMYKKLTGGVVLSSKQNYINDLDKMIDESIFKNDENIDPKHLKQEYIKSLSSLLDENFNPAPDRCMLTKFGGKLSIDEFRKSSKERVIYKMHEYPMILIQHNVEEINMNNIKDKNIDFFTLEKAKTNEINKRTESKNIVESSKKIEDAKNRLKHVKKEETPAPDDNTIDRFLRF